MSLYPAQPDREPFQTRFWVSSEGGEIVPTEVVAEASEAVEKRLERDFPLYRAVQTGKRAVAWLVGEGNEV